MIPRQAKTAQKPEADGKYVKPAHKKRTTLQQFQKVSGRVSGGEKKAAANAVCLHVSANKNRPPERPQTLRGSKIKLFFRFSRDTGSLPEVLRRAVPALP